MAHTIEHNVPAHVNSETLSQNQRAAIRALIEARLDGLKGKERNRRRNELLHQLPKALGVEGIKGITPALYPSAVAWLTGQAQAHTPEQTRERLLSLMEQLSDKLEPEPAPLPETVKPGCLQYLPPLYARRTAVDKAAENLWKAVSELKYAMKPLRAEIPAASNVRAWAVAMDHMEQVLDSMCQSVQNGVDAIARQALLMAQLLVLAANGEVELPEGMDDCEDVEAGNE
ncbi:hypothetical protein [Desulfovibrio sp. SGI.169]|uniref:hypothetical protein n=1 Tax=Desulfovibrio sp. SGI.169 TaxID=3420561 RepID=UPI003D039894